MNDEPKWYDAHLDYYRETAYVNSKERYDELYRRSIQETDAFWGEQAKKYLTWIKPWRSVLKYNFEEANISWFQGGQLNACANCLDRHIDKLEGNIAYYWEGDDPKETREITYGDLFEEVNKMAAFLKLRGVKKGDRVIIYMPMVAELPVALLACARIGAVHSVVFAGFSAEALANRIRNCGARAVITADAGMRGGKSIPLKKTVDEALTGCPDINLVIVYRRE